MHDALITDAWLELVFDKHVIAKMRAQPGVGIRVDHGTHSQDYTIYAEITFETMSDLHTQLTAALADMDKRCV